MGGPRNHARGIDENGNSANTVECEQLFVHQKGQLQQEIYSYTQIRCSAPFYWTMENSKTKIDRSLESSKDGFIKHFDSLIADYKSEKDHHTTVVVVNLLNQQTLNEEVLSQGYKKLIQDTENNVLQKREKRINYEYFDFHANCKKGSFALLDQYIGESLKSKYAREISFFKESVKYEIGDRKYGLKLASRQVLSWQ